MSDGLRLSHDTLRRLIGWLGLTLPLGVFVGAGGFQPSISDYYYTNVRDYFEGVLFFLAAFLWAYRPYGKDGWQDNVVTTAAAFCALLVALFPTINPGVQHRPGALVLSFVPLAWSGPLHNVGSGGLFLCFAVMALFYFTKGPREGRSSRKRLRNVLYGLAGLGILACIAWIGYQQVAAPSQEARDQLDIWWPETIALVLFGLSWLVKGGQFRWLNDRVA